MNRPLTNGVATSGTFNPQIGNTTYTVVATYNGDASYNTVSGACNAENEQVVVSKAPPSITTMVSETARVVGQPFTDTATVAGVANGPTPTGTVSFRLYTSVAACLASPQSPEAESLNRPLTNGVATSGTFNPQIGNTTYTVVATYNGDASYNTVSGACNAENEQVVVSKAPPSITTMVSETARVVGQPFTDTATVAGVANGPTPTGTVSFRLYTSVAACLASPQSPEAESLNRPLTNGVATSGTFNPQIGNTTYTVVATYNGDASYNTVSGACNAENEQVVVSKAPPSITTMVSETARVVGQSFTDTATVAGAANGPTPTGTVSFRLYTSVAACLASPQSPEAESLNRPLTNGVATSGTFTPLIGGTTYTVVATYNGDASYNTVSGACNAENEQVVVSKLQPSITTQVSDATLTSGESFTDMATVAGSIGGPTPTGTVTFRLYTSVAACIASPQSPEATSPDRPLTRWGRNIRFVYATEQLDVHGGSDVQRQLGLQHGLGCVQRGERAGRGGTATRDRSGEDRHASQPAAADAAISRSRSSSTTRVPRRSRS